MSAARPPRPSRWALMLLVCLFTASGALRLGGLNLAWASLSPDAADARPDPAGPGGTCTSLAALDTTLDRVRGRAEALDARETALDEREQSLRVSRQLVEGELARLEALETRLESLLALSDEAAETDLGRLTTVYETMDPADAAALFERMEPSFAAGFLGRMRADAAAGVLAALDPAVAYSFSVLLATRNAQAPRGGPGPVTEN